MITRKSLATNTNLAKRMNDIIDIDSGGIIRGEKTIQQMGEEILEYCIEAASGEVTPKAVLLGRMILYRGSGAFLFKTNKFYKIITNSKLVGIQKGRRL
jgi:hypothetical protein